MISKESILVILGSPIAYYTVFAKVLGGVEEGIFVSQFFYWYGRGHDPEGWIYKTRDEIRFETGLSRRNQETARKSLRASGVLEEKRMGAPSRLFYRLNLDMLFSLVNAWSATESPSGGGLPNSVKSETRDSTKRESALVRSANPPSYEARNVPSRKRESRFLEGANPPIKKGGSRPSHYISKTTSKTTPENTNIIINGNRNTNQNDDDDEHSSISQDFVLSSNQPEDRPIRTQVMSELAKEIIKDMGRGVWNGYKAFVDECNADQLYNLLTWLWLWDLTEGPTDVDPRLQWTKREFYHNPFGGVESIPGKIITQVRKGYDADLTEEDHAELQRCLDERTKKLTENDALQPGETRN